MQIKTSAKVIENLGHWRRVTRHCQAIYSFAAKRRARQGQSIKVQVTIISIGGQATQAYDVASKWTLPK